MLKGELYYPIYLTIIAIMSIVTAQAYVRRTMRHELHSAASIPFASLLLTILLVVAIGLRPLYRGFIDMLNYNETFYYLQLNMPVFRFDWSERNLIFSNLLSWCANTFPTPTEFFFIIALVYFGGILIACRRMFPGNTLAGLLTYLAAFSTFSYGVNGIRAGAASAVFLIALTCYNKKWLMLLLALVSMGIHHSMQLCIATLVIAMLIRAPRFYFALWMVCVLVSLFHITAFQDLFASMTDESGAKYLGQIVEDENKGLSGFRIDFILYSFTPIAMWLYVALVKKMRSEYYNFLISLYLLTNAVWLLCIYASFTNRIAYLSWFMLPIVLIYPVLHPSWGEKRFQDFSFIMLAHLSFTLFMNFIYYA